MGLVTALVRWRAGVVADRHGAQPFLWPLVILTGIGMAGTAWSVADPRHTQVAAFLVSMVVVGVGYGALQNLTLVMSFNTVPASRHNLASAVWNVGFDAGTGLGSVLVGAVALQWSFTTALLVTAAAAVATLPLALRRVPDPGRGPGTR